MSTAAAILGPAPPASAIADVLALWDRDGWVTPPLAPIVPAAEPAAGRARVVTIAAGDGGAGLGALYDVLDGDLAGCALVLAGADRLGAAVWGEILGWTAARAEAGAVLVDGWVRDVGDLPPTPLYARGTHVVGPNGRAQVVAVDEPAAVGDTPIASGDVVVADATGCVRVGGADADAVFAAAREYAAAEAEVLDEIRRGTPLAKAYLIKKSAVSRLRRG